MAAWMGGDSEGYSLFYIRSKMLDEEEEDVKQIQPSHSRRWKSPPRDGEELEMVGKDLKLMPSQKFNREPGLLPLQTCTSL